MLWQGFSRKEWLLDGLCNRLLQWWSHYRSAKPCLAARWFSLISDGISHQAELTSVRRQEHLLPCPSRLQPLPARQRLRKSEEPHGNNYHSVLVGQPLCLQCLWFDFGPSWLRGGSAGLISSSGQLHVPCCTQACFGKTNLFSFSLAFQVGRPQSLRRKQCGK